MALLLTLYILLILDGAFSGVCAASGRNPLIKKLPYYFRSMRHGAYYAHIALAVGCAMIGLVLVCSSDRSETISQLRSVGEKMAFVYLVYAAAVFVTFAIRAIPSVDVRAVTSTIGFGPLTLIRPAVVMTGIIWGLSTGPSPMVIAAGLGIAAMMMPFRILLNAQFAKLPEYNWSQGDGVPV